MGLIFESIAEQLCATEKCRALPMIRNWGAGGPGSRSHPTEIDMSAVH